MLARRLPLLWVFAGGCLSGATLIVFFRGEPEPLPSPREQRMPERTTEVSVPPTADTGAVRDDTLADEAAVIEPASRKDNDDSDGDSPAEPGSSVADVLAHLEAAYRQGLAAAAPANAPSSPDTGAPAQVPAREEPVVAVAVAAPSPTVRPESAPPAAAPPAPAPPAAQALASRDEAPRDIHSGDVNQNTTTIGSLHQGDVVLLQQLAYLQYIQSFPLLTETQVASAASGAHVAATTNGARVAFATSGARAVSPTHFPRSVTTRGAPTFSFPIINPDNPWGFDFPPPVLVK